MDKIKKRIDIKLSYKCNNHCEFCVQGDKRKFYRDKSFSEVKKILKESNRSYEEVVFTGGEPTIRSDFIKLVEYSKDLGYRAHIQTNGRMFAYKDFCKRTIEAGDAAFTVSIHGHNARLHDTLTGVEGSFEQTIRGIKQLISLKAEVFTNSVITALNYCFLPKIATMVIDLGIFEYRLSFPHILGRALINKDWIVPRKKAIAPYLKKALEIGIKRGRFPLVEAVPHCFLIEYAYCASENYLPETKVFDIKPIADFNHWRRHEGKLKGPKCRKCKYFRYCEGPWREYPEVFGWEEFVPII